MFMTEVLNRCSQLELRVADIYTQFAHNETEDRELKSYWLGLAAEEKHHAKILEAEKAALEVDSDPGYFMPEFEVKLIEMDQELRRAEEQAQQGARQDKAFAIAMSLEQSELNTIYRDLVLMGRAAVKLMARHMDQSLSIPKHQREFIEGAKRFVSEGPIREQIEAWGSQLAKPAVELGVPDLELKG